MLSKSHPHLLSTTRSCIYVTLVSMSIWFLLIIIAGMTSFKIMELHILAVMFLVVLIHGLMLLGILISLLFRLEHFKELLFCIYVLSLPILFFSITINLI